MTFKLRIPGRDDSEVATIANPANLLILTEPISGLAGLANIAEEIKARQLAADLIRAAMRVCDRHGDGDAARQEMRDQVLATPAHLHPDLLDHFTGKRRNWGNG